MTKEFFKKVLSETLEDINQKLGIKAMEYTRNNNPMHNFESGANVLGCTREDVINFYALKHRVSIDDIRNDIAEGKLPKRETVEEKFGDLINYLILEKASILDRIKKED